MSPRISVVVPSYNRHDSVDRLLQQLGKQTVTDFEVVLVDDGSKVDPTARFRGITLPYSLVVLRQTNAGAAAARHRGAVEAKAKVVLFLDDDMQVPPHLLSAHLQIHDRDPNAVVLGRIAPDPSMQFELFERFHAEVLERLARDVMAGRAKLVGTNVYTGNLSMRKEAYERVGGFDFSLGHSEDAELGVRLEKDGATFYLSDEASSVHSSDRASLEGFRKRAKLYGVFDSRIGKKHADMPQANPWRYFRSLSRLSRPILAGAIALPDAAAHVATAALAVSGVLDRVGLTRVALAGTTVAYGIDYARGMRQEAGSLRAAVTDYVAYARSAGPSSRVLTTASAAIDATHAVAADHETLQHYGEKYGGRTADPSDLPKDAVRRIGFQIMVAVRLMHFFRDAGSKTGAMITSRMIRHLYGSDIHWDASIMPGVLIVHGMGLAISSKARIGHDAILFQNVTLGESTGPETHETGAPTIGPNVHIMPGATLLGPITVGERSKIMAGCVVRTSVPPDSLVLAPEPEVRSRIVARPGARRRSTSS